MITISELAVFGIAQFTFGLLLVVVFLTVFIHKLRGQLTDNARTIQELNKKSKAPEIKQMPPTHHHYSALISNELQNTTAYFQSAADGQTMSISNGSQDSKIASIRHLFLTAELEAATGDTSWEIFSNAYAPLIAESSQPVESDADIFCRNKWADLTEAATRVLEDGSAGSQQILGSLIQTITRDLGFDEVDAPDINPQLFENARQNQPTQH